MKLSWRILLPFILLLLFLSVMATRAKRATWYEQIVWNVVSPGTSLFAKMKNGVQGGWHRYFYLVSVVDENEHLKNQLAQLEQTKAEHEELSQENKRLRELLDLQAKTGRKGIAAFVISFDPNAQFKTVRINRGFRDGIKPNMPVIAEEGLVGRVGPVFKNDALVLLIVDPGSHVGVEASRSGLRSLLSGVGIKKHLELRHYFFLSRIEFLKKNSDIEIEDRVVTSGLDQIYPSGVLVGTVTEIDRDPHGIFARAEVLPAVDFTTLKEVLVLRE
ncbi:MAG: rod shape-determining protein MreC [Deltaproteobacteria bacterium]|nr:rod shape-determining protein MreC [Deltaproteobacteria bacterium]